MISFNDLDVSIIKTLRDTGIALGYSVPRVGKTEVQYRADREALITTNKFCVEYIIRNMSETDAQRESAPAFGVLRTSTEGMYSVAQDYMWVQETEIGPNLNKWYKQGVADVNKVCYTLFFNYTNTRERNAMERILMEAFKQQASLKLYNVSGDTYTFYDTVEVYRDEIESTPFTNIVGVGMCKIEVYNLIMQLPRYWSDVTNTFELSKANATFYPDVEGFAPLKINGTNGTAVA